MTNSVAHLPGLRNYRGSELNSKLFIESFEPFETGSNRPLNKGGGVVELAILEKNPAIVDVTDIALGYSGRYIDPGQLQVLSTPTTAGFDARSIDTSKLSSFDLNGDGAPDEFVFKIAKPSVNTQLQVTKVTPTEWVPTSESAQILVGKGDVSTTWVLRKEDTHTTSETFEKNWHVDATVTASGTVFGVGVSTSVTAGGGGSEATTETNTFTVANETRQTYTIPSGKYEEGTHVRYGYHVLKGEVDIEEEIVILYHISNAMDGFADILFITADTKSTFHNYGLDLLLTDYDVSAPPDFSQISYDGLFV